MRPCAFSVPTFQGNPWGRERVKPWSHPLRISNIWCCRRYLRAVQFDMCANRQSHDGARRNIFDIKMGQIEKGQRKNNKLGADVRRPLSLHSLLCRQNILSISREGARGLLRVCASMFNQTHMLRSQSICYYTWWAWMCDVDALSSSSSVFYPWCLDGLASHGRILLNIIQLWHRIRVWLSLTTVVLSLIEATIIRWIWPPRIGFRIRWTCRLDRRARANFL